MKNILLDPTESKGLKCPIHWRTSPPQAKSVETSSTQEPPGTHPPLLDACGGDFNVKFLHLLKFLARVHVYVVRAIIGAIGGEKGRSEGVIVFLRNGFESQLSGAGSTYACSGGQMARGLAGEWREIRVGGWRGFLSTVLKTTDTNREWDLVEFMGGKVGLLEIYMFYLRVRERDHTTTILYPVIAITHQTQPKQSKATCVSSFVAYLFLFLSLTLFFFYI